MPSATPVSPKIRPDESLADSVVFNDIVSAAATLRGIAHRSPVLTSRAIDTLTGASVMLKCESFQRVGAFKFRGAYNAISQLPGNANGVLAYSSGNHAQGVALASAMLGVRAVIVMPADAPAVKIAATRGYLEAGGAQTGSVKGSEVVTFDPATTVREELGARIAEERGLAIVPPYDHPHIIAGQGTAAMELIEDHGPFDALYVCCGGGGLLSGSAIASRAMQPGCRVVGVEPELGDDVTESFRTGVLHAVHRPPTIADGARTPRPGRYTFPIIRRDVDAMMTVADDELRSAMRLVFERMKLVVEPSGVLGLAGVLRDAKERPELVRGRRIGVLLSGGNVDPAEFSGLISGGGRA
ncbi:MAG: pyridoxal-phosphate dependent enzyme [Planctomycetota bacterium]